MPEIENNEIIVLLGAAITIVSSENEQPKNIWKKLFRQKNMFLILDIVFQGFEFRIWVLQSFKEGNVLKIWILGVKVKNVRNLWRFLDWMNLGNLQTIATSVLEQLINFLVGKWLWKSRKCVKCFLFLNFSKFHPPTPLLILDYSLNL